MLAKGCFRPQLGTCEWMYSGSEDRISEQDHPYKDVIELTSL